MVAVTDVGPAAAACVCCESGSRASTAPPEISECSEGAPLDDSQRRGGAGRVPEHGAVGFRGVERHDKYDGS
eukprot:8304934-Lingulodinium_polyedra.AAC.2